MKLFKYTVSERKLLRYFNKLSSKEQFIVYYFMKKDYENLLVECNLIDNKDHLYKERYVDTVNNISVLVNHGYRFKFCYIEFTINCNDKKYYSEDKWYNDITISEYGRIIALIKDTYIENNKKEEVIKMDNRMKVQEDLQKIKKDYVGARFKHFKGNYYIVIDIAVHSETEEPMVIYKSEANTELTWCRPLDMFISEVDHVKYPNVEQKYRFERV